METTDTSMILFGEPRIVAEFARLLEEQNKNFYILNSISEYIDEINFAELLADSIESGTEEDSVDSSDEINHYYDEFAENVVFSLDEIDDGEKIDVIIDCTLESAETKVHILQHICDEYPTALILCSTLTCTATEVNAGLPLSAQVVGFGAYPGFTGRKLIEIAPSLRTRSITHQRAKNFFHDLKFETEIVEDTVGLVVPRMLAMLMNEAAFAVMEKVASAADIDTAMKLGVNYPKGLLAWADEIGADVLTTILDSLYEEYKQERYRPCSLLKHHVNAGWYGVETGRGFFNYMPMN